MLSIKCRRAFKFAFFKKKKMLLALSVTQKILKLHLPTTWWKAMSWFTTLGRGRGELKMHSGRMRLERRSCPQRPHGPSQTSQSPQWRWDSYSHSALGDDQEAQETKLSRVKPGEARGSPGESASSPISERLQRNAIYLRHTVISSF